MAVGFFTQGVDYHLPHPRISRRTTLLICEVFKKAWQMLKDNPPPNFELPIENEDTITQILVEIIENRIRKVNEVDGFNCATFGRVTREPKITNFDKTHPDKMPDIFFDLKRETLPVLNDQDGLFVECKPVDRKHTLFSCYCQKGLIRFVTGDYAWAMQDALMVGYVQTPYTFQKLSNALELDSKSANLDTTHHSSLAPPELYHSIHKRNFQWPEQRGKACQIEVLHLWLEICV